ncbi:MAG: ROK family transcriptional regulator, partial [Clostridia bacterium]|nr:ROK family transcriptional regulator [Clostridia bacterium]
MNDTGYNLRSMRAENKKLLLRLLGAQGPMSRKALAEAAQLTPAAVSKLCTELIAEGRIAETAPAETAGAGRREIPLRLCLQEKLILGVNAETTQISYALCTLSGQLRALLQTPFTTGTAAVLKTAQGFLAAHAVDPEALFAVGVCIVGAVGTGSYGLWDAQAIRAAFEAAFCRPVA